jgi:hypothetical protein
MRAIDLTGQKFGRLTALELGDPYVTPKGVTRRRWVCECECGVRRLVLQASLASGSSRSCGCLSRGENNHAWTGDDVSYDGIHMRLAKWQGRAADRACVDCGAGAHQWSYRRGCPDERTTQRGSYEVPYCPHTECYEPRCQQCHWKYDREEEVA